MRARLSTRIRHLTELHSTMQCDRLPNDNRAIVNRHDIQCWIKIVIMDIEFHCDLLIIFFIYYFFLRQN